MTHSKRQLQPQLPVPPDTAPPLRAGAGQPQTLGSPEAHPGLWAHTCADSCVWIYMPTDLQEPEHTHRTHRRRPAPSPGPHVAGTPGQCRELPWEPGPASRVSRKLCSSPALLSQALRMKDFREGMLMVPGFSPAGSQAQALSKGGGMGGS